MSKVFYIHGYGSSVNSETLQKLRKSFPDAVGLTYDPLNPKGSILHLAVQLSDKEDNDYPVIIGSSLGGWFVEQLSLVVQADFILYNPCISPELSLAKYNLSQVDLDKYKLSKSRSVPRTIVLSLDDEIIDPKLTIEKYKDSSEIISTSGGHRMTDENLDLIVKRVIYLQNQLTL